MSSFPIIYMYFFLQQFSRVLRKRSAGVHMRVSVLAHAHAYPIPQAIQQPVRNTCSSRADAVGPSKKGEREIGDGELPLTSSSSDAQLQRPRRRGRGDVVQRRRPASSIATEGLFAGFPRLVGWRNDIQRGDGDQIQPTCGRSLFNPARSITTIQ